MQVVANACQDSQHRLHLRRDHVRLRVQALAMGSQRSHEIGHVQRGRQRQQVMMMLAPVEERGVVIALVAQFDHALNDQLDLIGHAQVNVCRGRVDRVRGKRRRHASHDAGERIRERKGRQELQGAFDGGTSGRSDLQARHRRNRRDLVPSRDRGQLLPHRRQRRDHRQAGGVPFCR